MVSSKQCVICHKPKKISNYYTNRDNKQGYAYDNTCKEDSRKMAKDIAGLKLYCELNDRKYQQELVDIATLEATKKYSDDIEYNSLPEDKRETFLFEKIRNIYFQRMGIFPHYQFIGTNEAPVLIDKINDDLEDEDIELTKNGKDKKIWSEIWRGNYTKATIAWLDAYYEDTILDYKIVTRNHQDYCRKIVKASLAQDEASNDMLNDIPGAEKRFDKATATFDKLSQSAKLSESKRSANEVSGLSTISEIVAKLEQTGFLQKKMIFEKDSIDQVGDDFRWTLVSVGGEL